MSLYFAIGTGAQVSGTLTACASYAGAETDDPTELRMFRRRFDGTWHDLTTSLDTAAQRICGAGPIIGGTQWAIFGLNAAPEVGPITGPAGVIIGGSPEQFSATFTDPDANDTHTGTWVWGDGTTSAATIASTGGVFTAKGEHAFSTGGINAVRLVIHDGGNISASPDFEVTVDAAAPVIHSLTATPSFLSLPANRTHIVALAVEATDDTGTVSCQVTEVVASARNIKKAEYAIVGPMAVRLTGFPHSVYTITVTCTDAVNRTSTKSVNVPVNHGNGNN